MLTERIRTRLTQGAGRATRNSADYAAVIMLGRDLANFCAQPGVQAASHPEIRAELCFGLDNSTGTQAREAMAAGICVEAGQISSRSTGGLRWVPSDRRRPRYRRQGCA